MSTSHRNDAGAGQPGDRILVWDAPVRVFHWLLVLCFAGAYLTGEEDGWRLLHVTLGYTMGGLIVFRIVWGLAGTRYARFSSFVRAPRSVAAYFRSILRGRPEHHVGHNPGGAWAILALLGLGLALTATGWLLDRQGGGDALEEAHELIANLMLALVIVHIAAVVVSSRLHHENLIGAMITGRKKGAPEDGIRSAWRILAALLLAAVLGFWWLQWQDPPAVPPKTEAATAHEAERKDD